MGDLMADQLAGAQKFQDGLEEQKKVSDRLFLENAAAVAGVSAATYAYQQARARKAAEWQAAFDNASPQEQQAMLAQVAVENAKVRRNRRVGLSLLAVFIVALVIGAVTGGGQGFFSVIVWTGAAIFGGMLVLGVAAAIVSGVQAVGREVKNGRL